MIESDVANRYDPIIQQIAALYSFDAVLSVFLRNLRVNREEWDSGRCGGHFYFEEAADDAGVELVDVIAEDADGGTIAITLHLIGSRDNWAEWYRWDGESVLRWPPPSVRLVK